MAWGKVLRLKEGSKESQDAHNSENCPLFMLPGDIRNRIYRDVFGNKTIHILRGRSQNRLRPAICKRPDCRESEASLSQVSWDGRLEGAMYDARHNACVGIGRDILELGLLRTCRQAHSESALIPFATNTFKMKFRHFEYFADALMAEQKSAVEHLSLWSVRIFFFQPRWSRVKHFVALKHLEIILAEMDRYWYRPFHWSLEHFVRLPLSEVSVIFHQSPMANPYFPSGFFIASNPGPRSLSDKIEESDAIKAYLLQDWRQLESERNAQYAVAKKKRHVLSAG